MADIRCPVCGKSNPVEQEICQFCQTRLKPLIFSPSIEEEGQYDLAAIGEWDNIHGLPSVPPEEPPGSGQDNLNPDDEEGTKDQPIVSNAEEYPENDETGPLTGLDGWSSSESQSEEILKPLPYSFKLRFTGAQRAHADLLQSILDEEGKVKAVPRHRERSYDFLLRWAIALVLFAVIIWPLFKNSPAAPLPPLPEESVQVYNLIGQLPPDARSLLVFDYEPGLSGEMDAAATGVLGQLLLNGAYLTLVSTSPTGPILAERFLSGLEGLQENGRNIQYVNLGFISGGPAGLRSFAENPQETLPYTLDGALAWGGAFPPLSGIGNLTDFNMVIVLVDDPATARSWIEQVQPRLSAQEDPTPLVMVVSAQAEPLVRPYYEANPRQVQGLVAGLRGGVAYTRLTGQENFSGAYWDAFSAGTSTAALVILAGSLASIVLVLVSRWKILQSEEGL